MVSFLERWCCEVDRRGMTRSFRVLYPIQASTTIHNVRNIVVTKLLDPALYPLTEIDILSNPLHLLSVDEGGNTIGQGRYQHFMVLTFQTDLQRTLAPKVKSLTIPFIGNSDSFALFKFDKTVEERLRQELRDNEAELSQCAEGDVNEKSLSEKVTTAKNILAQAEEDNKLLQQSSPTLWFLSPRSDPRSAGLLKPTSGGSCTRMSHRMNRNFLSIAHTFPEHGAMESILSGITNRTDPFGLLPSPISTRTQECSQ